MNINLNPYQIIINHLSLEYQSKSDLNSIKTLIKISTSKLLQIRIFTNQYPQPRCTHTTNQTPKMIPQEEKGLQYPFKSSTKNLGIQNPSLSSSFKLNQQRPRIHTKNQSKTSILIQSSIGKIKTSNRFHLQINSQISSNQ
jgi:hypothetical protein